MSILSQKRVALLPKAYWLNDECFAKWLVRHLSPFGRTICDVGAGDGFMLSYMNASFSKVFAVEPSLCAIQVIKNRVEVQNMRIIQAKAESIPLPDSSVDIAIAKSSLHHFEVMTLGLREMRRIGKRAVAVVEVIAPTPTALKFAQDLLPQKELSRPRSAVFSEMNLKARVARVSEDVRCLHFDQYIDVKLWLASSDLKREAQMRIYSLIENQTGEIKRDMHIHFQMGRLVMLRRMALVIGLIK